MVVSGVSLVNNKINLVLVDEFAGDFRGAVRIGLRVLDDDFDLDRFAIVGSFCSMASLMPATNKILRFAEPGERTGERRDEADLEGARSAAKARDDRIAGAASEAPADFTKVLRLISRIGHGYLPNASVIGLVSRRG